MNNVVLVFTDAAYRKPNDNSTFAFVTIFQGSIVGAGAFKGPKVISPQKVEARV